MKVNLSNALKPNGRTVPVTVTVEHSDQIKTNDGELVYIVSLHTGARGADGKQVDPVYIDSVSSESVQQEIQRGLAIIGSKINWGLLEEDSKAPIITNILPSPRQDNVPISQDVMVSLKDPFPASFIDPTTIRLKVNGIDVTGDLKVIEKNNEVFLHWIPTRVQR